MRPLRAVSAALALLLVAVTAGAQVPDWPTEKPPRPLPAKDVNPAMPVIPTISRRVTSGFGLMG